MSEENYLLIGDLSHIKNKIGSQPSEYKKFIELCKSYERIKLNNKSESQPAFAILNLTLLALITDDRRWIEESKRWLFFSVKLLDKSSEDNTPLLFSISLSFNWLNKYLQFEEKNQITLILLNKNRSIFNHILKRQTGDWPGQYWYYKNWLNYTAFITTAYVLQTYNVNESKVWIELAKKNFKNVITLLPDDGSSYEGISKWQVGVLWLLIYADIIKKEENIDLFKESEYLKNTFFYRLYLCSPVFDQFYNFGNCDRKRGGHSAAIYYKLASEFEIKEAQWMGNHITKSDSYKESEILHETFLELLWLNPDINKKPPTSLKKSRFFPDLGLLSCRSSWSPNSFAFAVKASAPGGNKQWRESIKLQELEGFSRRNLKNQHTDDGSIILWKGLNNYVIDDGLNNDKSTSNHNMILFDGKGYGWDGMNGEYLDTKIHQQPEIVSAIKKGELIYLVMDLSKMYDEKLEVKKLKRHFFYCGKKSLLVLDEAHSTNTETISWQIHTEDHLEKVNNQYKTKDGNFIFTPLLQEHLVTSRSTKVIESEYRQRMENLTLHTRNNGDTTYFLKHFDTDSDAGVVEFEEIMNDDWIGISIKRPTTIDTIMFSKNPERNEVSSLPYIDGSSDASFIYLQELNGELYDSFFIGDTLNLSGNDIENSLVENLMSK